MFNFDDRLSAVATAAWEIWTNNGNKMDEDDREQTGKSVLDAANNEYVDGISDKDWLRKTLIRLGHPSSINQRFA